MKPVALLVSLFVLLTITMAPVSAGELHQALQEQIQKTDATEYVRVWIRLVSNENSRDLKREIARASSSRAERHQRALNRLKGEASRQDNLLSELRDLERRDLARHTKGHWITNVVETEVRASELNRLAARSDVELIYQEPKLELIPTPPMRDALSSSEPQSVGLNLTHIKAPEAWAAGFDGTGRLICSFDSGVDGDHPALIDNWKGHDGDSAAAWFDPIGQEPFPQTIPGVSSSHGTRAIGLIVGRDNATGDTVGVAPGAKWIAAAVMDLPGASFLDGWEWAVDPDGNPNTLDDVPDVISHSWGVKTVVNLSCFDIFYNAIDNSEAMGIVNIFASGNEGGVGTVRNPADRALDSIDCFAVGDLNHNVVPPVITGSSSGGPSPCNLGIKPNVVAPGNGVRTTNPGGGYFDFAGTSAAAPHVAGLVAILRQKNPDATVDEIKTAILVSTRRADFGTIPNNTFGWGEIDCLAALNALPAPPSQPKIRLFDFTHSPILPGDTVTGSLVLQNLGATASNVTVNITGNNDALTVLDGFASFGNIAQHDTVRSGDDVQVVVADTITVGNIISIDMTISGTGFTTPARLHFLIEPKQSKAIATHNTGRITVSLSNFGALGMGSGSPFPAGGEGFTFDGGADDLWEGGIMLAVSPTQVSSSVHSFWWDPDMEMKVAPNGNMQFSTSPSDVREQSRAIFNDSLAENPIGIEITQEGFSQAPPDDDFVTLRYILNNISGAPISELYFGIHLDWDIVSYTNNSGGYDSANGYVWMANNGFDYRGVKLIEGTLASAGAADGPDIIYAPPWGIASDDGYQKYEKYNILTSGLLYANVNKTANAELFSFLSAGPINLPAGGKDTVGFAILAGDTKAAMDDAAARAVAIPTDAPDDRPGSVLPENFVLHQNYPNPFNPSTFISFEIPKRGEYRMEIINMLGQTVHEQTAMANAGVVKVLWDARDYASGAYFYRVTVGDQVAAGKMLLLK